MSKPFDKELIDVIEEAPMTINPCWKCRRDLSEHVAHNKHETPMHIHCPCGHTVTIPWYTGYKTTVKIWNKANPILNKCKNCHGANLLTFYENYIKNWSTIKCRCGVGVEIPNEQLEYNKSALVDLWNKVNPLSNFMFEVENRLDEMEPCIKCDKKSVTVHTGLKDPLDPYKATCSCGHIVSIPHYVSEHDLLEHWNKANLSPINESSPISEQVLSAVSEIDPLEIFNSIMKKSIQKVVGDHLSKVSRTKMDLEPLRKGPKADVCGVFKVQYKDGDGQLGGSEDISERRVVKFIGEEAATALKIGRVEDGYIDTEWARYTWVD